MTWTKVTPTTLPPDGEAVMVTVIDNRDKRKYVWMNMYIGDFDNNWWSHGEQMPDYFTVTHWAPMPQPAEDEEDALEKVLQEFDIEFPPGGYMHGPGSVIQYNVDRFKAMHPEFFAED